MKKNRQILVLAALLFSFLCFPADKVLAASNVVEVPLTVKQNFEENSNEKGIDLTGTYEFRALDIGIPMPGDSDNDRHVFVLDGNNAEKMISLQFQHGGVYRYHLVQTSKDSRYDIKGRKHIGANLKYYFTDLGLRNARLNFRQQEPTHIMENIVYNELLIRGYNVDVGVVEVFDRNKEGKRVRKQLEVDFVVNQSSQRYYIQVAYDMTSEEKQTQEFNSLRNIPDSFKKVVIVNGSKKPWRNDEGFVIMGMKYFLLNANSLEY